MEQTLAFLNNLQDASPETLIICVISFFLLGVIWYQTGRFFLIGWLVKILWLIVFAPIHIFLWILSLFTNSFIDAFRTSDFLSRLSTISLIFLCVYSFFYQPDLLYISIPLTLIFWYLMLFGIDSERIRNRIFYVPKAKRTPTLEIKPPKPPKAQKQPKTSASEQNSKPEKPIIVTIVAKTSGKPDDEQAIIQKLEPHLQNLIRGR